jgi:hypothetical protein
MEAIYLVNGTVKVREVGSTVDLAVVQDVDTMVSCVLKQTQKIFKGASPTPVRSHTIESEVTVKIQKCPFNAEQLYRLCGLTKDATDLLEDGETVSTSYTLTNGITNRPIVDLLINGKNSVTGINGEIHAVRAVLQNDFDFSQHVNDFSMQELDFLVIRDTEAATDTYFKNSFENTAVSTPTISQIFPATGAEAGGTTIGIVGTGFEASLTVTVGGTLATSITVQNSTLITCVTPAGTGASDVVVTNTDTGTVTEEDGFTYT